MLMNQVFGKMKVEGRGRDASLFNSGYLFRKKKIARMEREENYPATSKLESTVEKERK